MFTLEKYIKIQEASLHKFNNTDTGFETKEISSGANSKYWILPNGTIVNLGKQWHYEYILNNVKTLKKFGIDISEIPENPTEQETRLYALSKGFVRMNYLVNGGFLTIEAPSNNWGRVIKGAIYDFVFDNKDRIDQCRILVLDSQGRPIKRGEWNWINSSSDQKMAEVSNIVEMVEYVDADPITESSLSRLFNHNQEHDCGAMSAFRKTYTRKENEQRHKSLKAKLMSGGYSVTEIIGKYPEGGVDKTITELSFFVVDVKNTGNLFSDMSKLGEYFEQDSILFIPKGAINNDSQAFLYGTSESPDSFPGYHNKKEFDFGKMGQGNPIYSPSIHGRPFSFNDKPIKESLNGYLRTCKPSETGMGTWAQLAIANMDWKKIEVSVE